MRSRSLSRVSSSSKSKSKLLEMMEEAQREQLLRIYAQTRTIAVVGASADASKAAHKIPRYLRIVRRRLHMRGEEFQLLGFTLFIEDLNRGQPARLRGAVQLAQVAQSFLARTIGRAHSFDQRPIGVLLAVLATMVRPQKHSEMIVS